MASHLNISDKLNKIKHQKLAALLASVFAYIFITPLFDNTFIFLINIALVALILSTAAIVLGKKKKIFLLFIGIVIAIEIITSYTAHYQLNIATRAVTLVFYFYIVVRLIEEILKREGVTLGTILEAINGYLLLGIAFSAMIGMLHDLMPEAYNISYANNDTLYFAFVTMTTLGYGDILPTLPISKSLTLIIAISGQFYVGVIVAILVGKYASQ